MLDDDLAATSAPPGCITTHRIDRAATEVDAPSRKRGFAKARPPDPRERRGNSASPVPVGSSRIERAARPRSASEGREAGQSPSRRILARHSSLRRDAPLRVFPSARKLSGSCGATSSASPHRQTAKTQRRKSVRGTRQPAGATDRPPSDDDVAAGIRPPSLHISPRRGPDPRRSRLTCCVGRRQTASSPLDAAPVPGPESRR